jgi:demethylmenaquinone methyltransferase/2-methoxy-6-polyprenyl-1,4-benzoquinol methylase
MPASVPHTAASDRGAFVREMFARIAPRYDLVNRLMTGGFDERWREAAITVLRAPHGGRIADLCCGTGDIALHLRRRDPSLHVTGVDFCEPMLERARARAGGADPGRLEWIAGDVAALPFPDRALDGAIMGFSSRNLTDLDAVLREVRRVLKPGARFVNLDASKPPNRLWKACFDAYFYHVVPLLGGWLGGSREAYAYLPQSLTRHPAADALRERFEDAGFVRCGYRRLMGGAIAIHWGEAP